MPKDPEGRVKPGLDLGSLPALPEIEGQINLIMISWQAGSPLETRASIWPVAEEQAAWACSIPRKSMEGSSFSIPSNSAAAWLAQAHLLDACFARGSLLATQPKPTCKAVKPG